MKEIFVRELKDKVFQYPQGVIDAGNDLISTYALLGHLRVDQLKPEAKRFVLTQVAKSLFEGRSRSLARDAKFILSEYEREIVGADNIPLEGPVLFIANHWSRGPLKGHWAAISLNEIVCQRRGSEPRWIKQDSLHIPIGGVYKVAPFSKRSNELGAITYHNILVSSPREKNGEGEVNTSGARTIIKFFRKGNMIGLYPEAMSSTVLLPGNMRAGFIAYALSKIRPDAVVCPVGEYSLGDGSLHLNIGKAFSACEILDHVEGATEEVRNQEAANFLIGKIKPLVPVKMRG